MSAMMASKSIVKGYMQGCMQFIYFLSKKVKTDFRLGRLNYFISSVLLMMIVAGCATRADRAPVTERSTIINHITPMTVIAPVPQGMVRVEPGDSLYRIAIRTGRNWRDLAAWNNISDANRIEPGQLLRTAPAENATFSPNNSASIITSTPIDQQNIEPAVPSITQHALPNSDKPISADGLSWPHDGIVSGRFDGKRNKGIDIEGKLGDPVLAAADGKVLYAGSGLRGYGNLIVIKHNNNLLTAYAHNSRLDVKEGDSIKRGQKIAEVGNSGVSDGKGKLHFEVRKTAAQNEGNAKDKADNSLIDPITVLPARKTN